MSSLAQQKANDIIESFHTNDPYFIAEKLEIDVLEQTMSGRLTELYFGDYIILNKNIPYSHKRRYLAHALGHHFLHAGNYLFFSQMRYLQNSKEETQAEEFAAHLLIPSEKLLPIIENDISELANHFQVSSTFMKFRLTLIQ
jgi:Zn-dependent peptidase ImmA (M78 family)